MPRLLPSGHEDKRRHLVAGLGTLMGADVAEWVETSEKDRVPRAEVSNCVFAASQCGRIVFSAGMGRHSPSVRRAWLVGSR